jgi:hypothetical protein
VFAEMRGPSIAGASAYDADHAAVGHAERIAERYGSGWRPPRRITP